METEWYCYGCGEDTGWWENAVNVASGITKNVGLDFAEDADDFECPDVIRLII